MCKWYANHSNYRIEYDDLFSEAQLKLWELYRDGKTDKNFIFISIKNHLIDYIRKNSVGREFSKGLIKF